MTLSDGVVEKLVNVRADWLQSKPGWQDCALCDTRWVGFPKSKCWSCGAEGEASRSPEWRGAATYTHADEEEETDVEARAC